MKLALRVTAFWIALVAMSLILLAVNDVVVPPGDFGGGGCMFPGLTIAGDPRTMRGVWALFAFGSLAAIELWRLRKVGLLLSASFLLLLVVGGVWHLCHGADQPMAVVPLAIDALLTTLLITPTSWRTCRSVL